MLSLLSNPLMRRLRRPALDAALAQGASPRTSRKHAARANELVSSRVRSDVALALRKLADEAERPHRGLSSRAPLRHQAIRAERLRLEHLEFELESERPVAARGVAILMMLLRDGCSPLYGFGVDDAPPLAEVLMRASDALSGDADDDPHRVRELMA